MIDNIPNDVLRISCSAIDALVKYGSVFLYKEIDKDSSIDTTNPYSQLYGQPSNEITYSFSIEMHGITIYEPSEDNFRGIGLEPNGDLLVSFSSMELLNLLAELDPVINIEFKDIKERIKNQHIEINGETYIINNVKPDAIYSGFPIMHHISCSLYSP